MSRAVPMSVPLEADVVGPCRLTFGSLSVAGADDEMRSPAADALFFETAEGSLGRVTFEGLDAIRASRGEVAPYDDGHDSSSWVYNVLDSTWLAERHAYEWSNYEARLLETHQHYLFRFHDEFVEAIAQGIWVDTIPASDPFAVGTDHPGSTLPLAKVVDRGEAHGLAWQVRSTEVDQPTLVADSELCSQRLFEFSLQLDGNDSVCASALVRTRDGRTRTHLTHPWSGVVASVRGVARPQDFAKQWDEYCHGVAERRREMGK
ncbi:hypothetical protein [Nocardioides nitrophenolicus]|uniref:hypothetical protein n=1 Tax=Nocardioides nitrophenolicus TaxID=60489 RepID=UPI0019562EA3|nr:hypothetical protein [Nocardioides nitrophenolicus]MBM7517114.1 hypothetical protein [Nocardioides nitrophenolicus]